jgi:hypothetical protein
MEEINLRRGPAKEMARALVAATERQRRWLGKP